MGLTDLRGDIRNRILFCKSCDLHTQTISPVPFSGPSDALYAVIGEAPGADEESKGKPFVGRSGALIRQLLGREGFDPDAGLWMNTVSCRPPDNRDPLPTESQACRANLLLQLGLTSREVCVLLLGSYALRAFMPGARVTVERGKPFYALGRKFLPTIHPASILYRPDDVTKLEEDLGVFRLMTQHAWWPSICHLCGKDVGTYDEWGRAWCWQHWCKPGGPGQMKLV